MVTTVIPLEEAQAVEAEVQVVLEGSVVEARQELLATQLFKVRHQVII